MSNDQIPAPEDRPAPAVTAPGPAATSRPRWLTFALAVVAALLVGGIAGGAIGNGIGSAQASAVARQGDGFAGRGGADAGPGGAADAGGGFVTGTITKVDGTTLTVKSPNGQSVTVTTTGSTTVTTAKKGKVTDLKQGDTVVVRGQQSNGSVAATVIQAGAGVRPGIVGN